MIAWWVIFAILSGGMVHDYLHGIKFSRSFWAMMNCLYVGGSVLTAWANTL